MLPLELACTVSQNGRPSEHTLAAFEAADLCNSGLDVQQCSGAAAIALWPLRRLVQLNVALLRLQREPGIHSTLCSSNFTRIMLCSGSAAVYV